MRSRLQYRYRPFPCCFAGTSQTAIGVPFDVGRSGPSVVDFSDIRIRVKQSTYGDWPFFDVAYREGERFALKRVDQEVSCATSNCLKTEIVGIDLSTGLLRELAGRPILSFRIVGRRGSMLVEIS